MTSMSTPWLEADGITVYHGDCNDIMRTLPDASVDAVVTDPPYGIRFMGQAWDGSDIQERQARGKRTSPMPDGVGGPNGGYRSLAAEAGRYNQRPETNRVFQDWCTEWARECYRLLKPGGHMLAFGSTRTSHRLTAGIEDAGFEIRDIIAWMYASGFPKSVNVAKAVTGHLAGYGSNSGALRRMAMGDDYEPSGVRGDRDGVTRRSDTGMAGRDIELAPEALPWNGWGTALKPAFEPCVVARKPLDGTIAENILQHAVGALNINACRTPISAADAARINSKHAGMDAATYERPAGASLNLSVNPMRLLPARAHDAGRWPTNLAMCPTVASLLDQQNPSGVSRKGSPRQGAPGSGWGISHTGTEYDDKGGPSRFFPTFRYEAKAPSTERPEVDGVTHPTVKPLALMRWLVRLIVPAGGIVLDPFAGSGTTLEACVAEGRESIGIEREKQYLPLIRQRLSKSIDVALDFNGWMI